MEKYILSIEDLKTVTEMLDKIMNELSDLSKIVAQDFERYKSYKTNIKPEVCVKDNEVFIKIKHAKEIYTAINYWNDGLKEMHSTGYDLCSLIFDLKKALSIKVEVANEN